MIGLYGVYLILIGVKSNEAELGALLARDFGHYIPWLVAVAILAALSESEILGPAVKPFALLLVLAFMLKNWSQIVAQWSATKKLYGI